MEEPKILESPPKVIYVDGILGTKELKKILNTGVLPSLKWGRIRKVRIFTLNKVLQEAEETKAFFGTKFDDTMKNVTIAVNSLEREYPGFVDALNKGNNKAVLQVLAKVGTLLKEDPGVGGSDKNKTENTPPRKIWKTLQLHFKRKSPGHQIYRKRTGSRPIRRGYRY